MGKRQEAALETKRKIIEVVKEMLKEKKIEDINIEDITNQAHIAKGSFYTHFKRKEDVISELAMSEYEIIKDWVSISSDDVYEQISNYLKQSVEIIEKNTLQVAQQWVKSVSAPLENESAGIRKYQYDRDNITDLLKKAVEIHQLDEKTPVSILAQMIVDNYYGAVMTWCMNKGQERTLYESIEHYCLYGLKPVIEIYKK